MAMIPGLTDFNKKLRDLMNVSFRSTFWEYLNKNVPNIEYFRRFIDNLANRTQLKLLHSPNAANTVDHSQMSTVLKTLRTEIKGTYNPIGIAWRTLLSVFGNRRQQRIDNALNILKEYAQLNNSPQFVNDALKDLLKLMYKRIGQVEGLFSKLGISTNKAVMEDKTLRALKETFQAWTQVFSSIIGGAFPGVGLPATDIPFLDQIESELEYGTPYLRELAPSVATIRDQARKLAGARVPAA